MLTEQGLYLQVVMLCRNYLKITEANKNENEAKFKFQGQSARLQRWLDLDFECIEEKFSTLETDFYTKIFQRHGKIQYRNTFNNFEVPIGNSKCVKKKVSQ